MSEYFYPLSFLLMFAACEGTLPDTPVLRLCADLAIEDNT